MVRQLPSGEAVPAVLLALANANLDIAPLAGEPSRFSVADLVEVTTAATICLGEVRSVDENKIRITVEHRLDREVLAEIARVWRRSEV